MKASGIVLCVLLVGILCSKVQAATRSNTARHCCEKYSRKHIAWKLVQTYELTKSSCSLSAVIFTTKKGQKVCADPAAQWTQKYVASLKSQNILT
ncbi:C-C motif chemokine 26 isoform X2 [Antechinus flavipes]|uniref:C-C motif chemokine 26 isoform X2 n=1 Tax=Antechinus flavipes TaxID=38775 RepID=UPI002235FCF0|nr:C-C motif chemokine 26 isoform X2 [Antechinus flavipes]